MTNVSLQTSQWSSRTIDRSLMLRPRQTQLHLHFISPNNAESYLSAWVFLLAKFTMRTHQFVSRIVRATSEAGAAWRMLFYLQRRDDTVLAECVGCSRLHHALYLPHLNRDERALSRAETKGYGCDADPTIHTTGRHDGVHCAVEGGTRSSSELAKLAHSE